MLGMGALAVTSVNVNSNANHLTWAYQTAQADLEMLRGLAWKYISSDSRTTKYKGVTFTSTWEVPKPTTENSNIKNVSLTVSWNDSQDHKIKVVTKIAR